MAFLNETGLAHLWTRIMEKLGEKTEDAVRYSPQTLTGEQKNQAKDNIDIYTQNEEPSNASVGAMWISTTNSTIESEEKIDTLNPTQSVYVNKGSNSTNYTDTDLLRVGVGSSSTIEYYTLLKFPVDELNGTISKATLRLYSFSNECWNASTTQIVKGITSEWEQDSVNWTNKPSVSNTPVSTMTDSGYEKWYEWDVTELVQSENFGFCVMQDGTSTSKAKCYKKSGDYVPQLIVEYTTNPINTKKVELKYKDEEGWQSLSSNGGSSSEASQAVKYVYQTLSEAQQAQARENIGVATKTEIIAEIVAGAPDTLDTLKEIADALADNEDEIGTILTQIGQKADKSWVEENYNTSSEIDDKINDAKQAVIEQFPEIPEAPGIAGTTGTATDWSDTQIVTDIQASLDTDGNYKVVGGKKELAGDGVIEVLNAASYGQIRVRHTTKTPTKNTGSASPQHGETFKVIDAVTYDSYGHVNSYTEKTITLPSLEEIQASYVHNYGTSLPTSGNVGDVFLLIE